MKATLTSLPDLARSLKRLKTLIDLQNEVNTDTIFGYAVKKGFIDKEPPSVIIGMIKDQLKDNREAVTNCIPEDIVKAIEENF
jgi:aryl-alcohol dehydrogenase-like predicted oxidoreductase